MPDLRRYPELSRFMKAAVREAGVMLAGALIAAWAIGQVPQLRAWMAAAVCGA